MKHKQRLSSLQLRIGVHDGLEAQLIASTLKRMNAEAEGFDPVIRMAPMSALRSMLENDLVDVLLESRDSAGEPDAASVFRRLMECPAGLSLRKARSTYGPRILSGARSILCSARSIHTLCCKPITAHRLLNEPSNHMSPFGFPSNRTARVA